MTKKWAKIINEETKACEVGLGTNNEYYKTHGYRYIDVVMSDDGCWYKKGYEPILGKTTNMIKIEELKKELSTYDYIGVKIATGCATIEEYAEQIAYCEELRKQIRKLKGETTEESEGAE